MQIKSSEKKRKLIQLFHVELKKGGMAKQKPAILESFGVASTKDLSEAELVTAIKGITNESDLWKKRVIAVIFSWYNTLNKEVDVAYVKGTACKATGYKHFNAIPVSRLRDLYFGWSKKDRAANSIVAFKEKIIKQLEECN